MIVSVSRRTDIPAFYSEWFFKRIEEGFAYVINPFNSKQVSLIELNNKTVDCLVFWTKDPEPMLEKLTILDEKNFKYYFQFTLTSYGKNIERGVRKKTQIIDTFIRLSKRIGKEKVIWRYDPILLSEYYTKDYHYRWFEELCKKFEGYTQKCVISFIDIYDKTKRSTRYLEIQEIKQADIYEISERLVSIAKKYNIVIETCSENINLEKYGIRRGKCVDDKLISKILNKTIDVKKDDTQREKCGCVKSIDIGTYNTCKHFCSYCYANFNYEKVNENCMKYDNNSPILVGNLKGDEKITIRKMESIISRESKEQIRFNT